MSNIKVGLHCLGEAYALARYSGQREGYVCLMRYDILSKKWQRFGSEMPSVVFNPLLQITTFDDLSEIVVYSCPVVYGARVYCATDTTFYILENSGWVEISVSNVALAKELLRNVRPGGLPSKHNLGILR